MLHNNPSFVEKLVQAKQEDRLREAQGFNEREYLNASEPIIKIKVKPMVMKVAVLVIALAWLSNVLV